MQETFVAFVHLYIFEGLIGYLHQKLNLTINLKMFMTFQIVSDFPALQGQKRRIRHVLSLSMQRKQCPMRLKKQHKTFLSRYSEMLGDFLRNFCYSDLLRCHMALASAFQNRTVKT